ncbi:uncharacterized protein LOC115957985 isoform X2 [Quercus lobata]|uniref:uncharacterized protein LOC115957985 isoform X2 n=1 Tax=Quercus lobata TaxID=97700 RepID=UPI0012493E98|nr:uncharacterized protein LOC115957985 isoform X2 [Quercus lobata]
MECQQGSRHWGKWPFMKHILGGAGSLIHSQHYNWHVEGPSYVKIGEYEETIGTCLVFTEEDGNPVVHEEVGPSEANLFSGKCIIDPNQTPSKQVKPVTQLQKILKFRLATDADIQCSTAEQTK